jgi:small GTP-binding protein
METPLVNHNNSCKIIFIGDSNVGKTNIISRFRYNMFEESYLTTIGLDFHVKSLNIRGENVKLNIWDTAGHAKFRDVLHPYYKTADVICFCYDITNTVSIEQINTWIYEARKYTPEDVIVYAIGNKIDLHYNRTVDNVQMKHYCKDDNIINIEVSARDSTNINNLFYDIAFKYLQKIKPVNLEMEHTKIYEKSCLDCCKIC